MGILTGQRIIAEPCCTSNFASREPKETHSSSRVDDTDMPVGWRLNKSLASWHLSPGRYDVLSFRQAILVVSDENDGTINAIDVLENGKAW